MRRVAFDSVGSTQDEARRLAELHPGEAVLVVAAEQTAGRGRRGRVWQSPRGGAWLSLAWPLRVDLPSQRYAAVPLAAAAAVLAGVERAVTAAGGTAGGAGEGLAIKWPNDLLLGDRKMAGVLCERVERAGGGGVMIVGVGVNVLNASPSDGEGRAAVRELVPAAGEGLVEGVVERVGEELVAAMRRLEGEGGAWAVEAVRRRLAWRGGLVEVALAGRERVAGEVYGLDLEGRLVLLSGGRLRALAAGELQRLRPATRYAPAAMDQTFNLPTEANLNLHELTNAAGLRVRVLPDGRPYLIEHEGVMLNLLPGTPLEGSAFRLLLRLRDGRDGSPTEAVEMVGPRFAASFGRVADTLVWRSEWNGIAWTATLRLHPDRAAWQWRVVAENRRDAPVDADAVMLQDVGLGDRGFVQNNEAYASQYIDHQPVDHPDLGHVLLCRQNLPQGGDARHPWLMLGCSPRCVAYATDAFQSVGLAHRIAGEPAAATADLPAERLQFELAMPSLQAETHHLEPGGRAEWTFFAAFEPDHPAASAASDLDRLPDAPWLVAPLPEPAAESLRPPVRNLFTDAPLLRPLPPTEADLDRWFPGERRHAERRDGRLLSFFRSGDGPNDPSRHVVLGEKDTLVLRRHGHILRTGRGTTLDERTVSTTAWMHGTFASQLTIGNTSFHKLLGVSRDPLQIVRSQGLRMFFRQVGGEWRLLGEPSAFEMGLSDCRWLYRHEGGVLEVRCGASEGGPRVCFAVESDREPVELLISMQVVLGERELQHSGTVQTTPHGFLLRAAPESMFGRNYPDASFEISATAGVVECGGDELLHEDGQRRDLGYGAMLTQPLTRFDFTIRGELKREEPRTASPPSTGYWDNLLGEIVERARSSDLPLPGWRETADVLADSLPWLVHDAMVHLTVPHGLEQYTGAAWGTRDVTQGSAELLMALDRPDDLRRLVLEVFAQQREDTGDWPQWFMHEPYDAIRDSHSHGDVILWPLKALCDCLNGSDDLAELDQAVGWRRGDGSPSEAASPLIDHVDRLLATVESRFIPGTALVRYGEGDWNDALQPADPTLRDTMVSSWTVALHHQQLANWDALLRRRGGEERRLEQVRASLNAVRDDFRRHLMPDGIVCGYAIFEEPRPDRPAEAAEYLLHPRDERTGVSCSLLPINRGIHAGLFTPAEIDRHLALARDRLDFPDGMRLMDRPIRYTGGTEQTFRRAESAAFFGREVGLMYTHAHLRFVEALMDVNRWDEVRDELLRVLPISCTEAVPNAAPRQRNAYFSSSDLAFADRYAAQSEWERARRGTVPAEGGWRVYSSGPGILVNLLVQMLRN